MRDTITRSIGIRSNGIRSIGGSVLVPAALLLSACSGGGEANNAVGSELGNVGAANTADPSAVEMNNGAGDSLPANLSTGTDRGSGSDSDDGAGAPAAGSGNGADDSDAETRSGGGTGGSDVGGDTGGNAGVDAAVT